MPFHNKPPPLNSLINPLTSSHLLSYRWMTNCSSHHKKILLPPQWCSFPPGYSLRPFPHSLPYLLGSFLPLWNWLCPLLSADAAVIEKHTLLRPSSLSLSLPDSHWLPIRGDITLLFCLPPTLLLCSLPHSVDSDHYCNLPYLPSCPLSIPSVLFVLPVYCVDYYSSCVQLSSAKHNNADCVLA